MTIPRTVLVLALFSVAVLPALFAAEGSRATVPKAGNAPVVDGKIGEGEWERAVRTSLFTGWRRKKFERRWAGARVTFTDERLYVAVESEVPPTGPIASKKFDDGRLVFDSSIELWIDPNRANRETGEGDQSYYQFIGNSIGTVRDVKFALGAPDIGWNANWEFENSVNMEKQLWTAELSVSWKDLGLEAGRVTGRSIGLVVARDFKAGWGQPTWMPLGAAFSSVAAYPELQLTEETPVVQVESLRYDYFLGQSPLRVRVSNPGPARTAELHLLITSTDMPKLEEKRVLELPEDGSATFEHSIRPGRLHETAQHTLNLVVRGPDSEQVYFRHKGGTWTPPGPKKWYVRTGPNPQAAAKIGYYPSLDLLTVRLKPDELGEEKGGIRSASIKVTNSAGKQLLQKNLQWAEDQKVGVGEYELSDIDDGTYSVTIELEGVEEPLTRTFERKHFVWEGNRLGVTNEIYPPFEPIQLDERDVSVALRRYRVNGLGLWDSVRARGNEESSDFQELLAGPVAVKVSEDSSEITAEGASIGGQGKFTSVKDHAAVYEGTGMHPGVRIENRTITEFDGCMRVEMDLLPTEGQEQIKSLWVEVPLRDSHMPLYHVSTTALRVNPAGDTPEGEGLIWDTRDFPDGAWPTGFRPYIWLGGAERGLCWFADNDRDWVVDVDRKEGTYAPAFSLHRNDGILTLRVHLVQKPVTLKRKRHIVFGLMATPAKPMPADWRAIGRPDHRGIRFNMGHVYGMYETYSSKYPLDKDFSSLNLHQAGRLGAPIDMNGFLSWWRNKHVTGDIPEKPRKRISGLIKIGAHRALRANRIQKDLFTCYFEEFHSTTVKGGEEAPTFFTEWSGRWLEENLFGETTPWRIHINTAGIVDSYRDFACWYGAEWLRRGFGLYFDNSNPRQSGDVHTTSAYRLPDGTVVPSAGMWARRAYLRRIWTLHRQLHNEDTPQTMMIHMTNTHIVPYMVWNDCNLDLEWRYGPQPAQAKYAADLLRAQSLGLQSGNIPVALADIKGEAESKEQKRRAARTRWAALTVHEIKGGITSEHYPEPMVAFGYGLPDCRVYNYWGEDAPMNLSDPRCKWLLLEREGKLMMLLCTWNGKESTVRASLDLKRLGLDVANVINAETGEKVAGLQHGTFSFELNGYGVRIFRLE
jgi:hypothetical protein